jgi:hypothetical protein
MIAGSARFDTGSQMQDHGIELQQAQPRDGSAYSIIISSCI